ncbi:MAG: bifunctional phosphoribosyl-AMP cyclohydrolase/phosphoribosyl-ATP diphosphatase HisIE [Gammaproteobacteria bacterium]|nr:bifunctional phosphoribosyl-AMP cyclohydrolase/phosphoribosyl-ATP diphosphatase HisIE [Gammaproteobacteria bacterium]
MSSLPEQVNWEKGDGLVPAIVQDAISGRVLMLGYMNVAALQRTLTSEYVTFFSRSRRCLWTKGETSGNKLHLVGIEIDCDGDTLLVNATPHGPTCHLGTSSCFDKAEEKPGFGFIGQLEATIADRLKTPRDDSYTTRLVNAGIQRIAQKIGEEGVEVALAAVAGNREEIVSEVADLLYHVLVLLRHQDLGIVDVARQLDRRRR